MTPCIPFVDRLSLSLDAKVLSLSLSLSLSPCSAWLSPVGRLRP